MRTSMYKSPDAIVSILEKAIESTFPMTDKAALSILDIGAGTGMVGEN